MQLSFCSLHIHDLYDHCWPDFRLPISQLQLQSYLYSGFITILGEAPYVSPVIWGNGHMRYSFCARPAVILHLTYKDFRGQHPPWQSCNSDVCWHAIRSELVLAWSSLSELMQFLQERNITRYHIYESNLQPPEWSVQLGINPNT